MIDIGFTSRHPGWPKFKAMLDRKIAELRELNDNQALTAEQTAGLRGEIGALKTLILAIENAPDTDSYNP